MLERLPSEKQQAVELLLRCGVTESIIVKETGVSLTAVREIAQMKSSTTFSTRLNPKDAQLADAMRDLAWKAYDEARITMEFGSPAERSSLVRAVIARSMALVGAEKSSTMDTIREEFNDLIGNIRSPIDTEYDLPEDDDYALEIGAASIDADDR